MSIFLAVTAASLASSVPALPQSSPAPAFRGGDWPVITGRGNPPGDRHRGRRLGNSVFVYDREYQGDSAWRSASFNDWWHEDTARSYPRWMQNNAGCERQWYAGDTLRC